ncbi:protein SDA1 homolog [Helianthus annuus]|uniref:protein SDA1 homolog n=1 Tax=Helianthus annuus TaxID=4232 RepID=UPI000B906891|nr:protein SDA1 homolog [Helianthus annuus]
MKRLSIQKSNEELIEKLADALPYESWGTYLLMLRNKKGFNSLTLSKFIEKIEAYEMEQRKVIRMRDFDGEQDVGLYYKAGVNEKSSNSSPKIVTGMSAKTYTAFAAKIEDDSDDDTEYWARKYRADMKLVAESDSEDDRVKKEKKKKKIKTPVSSDDEEGSLMSSDDEEVKCENCEIVKKQNSTLINNLNRLKESYDVLNKTMNQYDQTSEEQAVAMRTLQGAFMTKQKVVNNYIEKIYPTVESMKVWEEDESTQEKAAEVSVGEKNADKKKSDRKKDTEKTSSGKKKDKMMNQNKFQSTVFVSA